MAAAADVITRQGVQNTSIAAIIAASGVSTGAIYHHFGNKRAIILEVARQTLQWPKEALLAWRDRPSSPDRLFEFAATALNEDHDLGDLLLQLGSGAATDDELGHELRAEFAEMRDVLDDTMTSWARLNGVPVERVDGLSQLLVGLILGLVAQRVLVESFDAEAYLVRGKALMTVARP